MAELAANAFFKLLVLFFNKVDIILKKFVSKTLHYLSVVQRQTHFLPTFLQRKLLILASLSYLKTLILLKGSQSQILNNCYAWLQRSPILYLMVCLTNKPMVQQWDHLSDPPWKTHFYHTMKKAGQRVVRKDLNRSFTDVMLTLFLFSSNRMIA